MLERLSNRPKLRPNAFREGEPGSSGGAPMMPEEGQVLTGPQFSEPVRVETVRADGPGGWVLGVVGIKTERFRRVTLTEADLAQIAIQSPTLAFDGDPNL